MRRSKVYLLLSCLVVAVVGCSESTSLTESIDRLLFARFGRTFLSAPEKVTLKEIHLDNADLLGRDVIIEGKITEVGKFLTYLVISDHTARMLVVLTHLRSHDVLYEDSKNRKLKVWGIVESGKKGFPYVQAKVIAFQGIDESIHSDDGNVHAVKTEESPTIPQVQ